MQKKIEIRKWSTHYNVAIFRSATALPRVRIASTRSYLNQILKEEKSCTMNTTWIATK